MGEYLSSPLKDKDSRDGENAQVTFRNVNCEHSLNMVPQLCRVGESLWRMLISLVSLRFGFRNLFLNLMISMIFTYLYSSRCR